ncbi:methylmalonyl-CoA mutase family protein [Polycladidibacter stylochi]|uniref:methylmalonyl-CoA mutase family protein n=1 Tax=Polycladidibacter stylochi TaxID=1807766 RepID=UPI00082D980F|nr:methylmalonyl-CoA mutase family protein [Pseudovibrio stylochi]
MAIQYVNLANEFLSFSQNDWEEAALKALRGRELTALESKDLDSLEIHPLYSRVLDSAPLKLREGSVPWTITARADFPNLQLANKQILEDLEGGAQGLELVLAGSMRARGCGLNLLNVDNALKLFEGVRLDLVELMIDAGRLGSSTLVVVLEAAARLGVSADKLKITGTTDLPSYFASSGAMYLTNERLPRYMADIKAFMQEKALKGPVFRADGRLFHDSGASPALELAIVLSGLIYYLRSLEEAGCQEDDLGRWVCSVLSATSDQFTTIAKARALRLLWAQLLEASGLKQHSIALHMESSYRMMTKHDPWVNLLRSTTACFAAGIGGANSVSALPHTSAYGCPDSMSRRFARNMQLILQEESHIAKVGDPSAGSGLIEQRTHDLAAQAWQLFQKIEQAGGIMSALENKLIFSLIEDCRAHEDKLVRFGHSKITGTSAFPNLNEEPQTVKRYNTQVPESGQFARYLRQPDAQGSQMKQLAEAIREGANTTDQIRLGKQAEGILCPPISAVRLSKPFEALRDSSDCIKDVTGSRPKVFLATLGNVSAFTGRATFASNFYAVGGIEACGGEEYTNLEALQKAFKESGSEIACICGQDEDYKSLGLNTLRALQEAGAKRVSLAGRLRDDREDWDEAGLTAQVFEGCDILRELHHCYTYFTACAACELETT